MSPSMPLNSPDAADDFVAQPLVAAAIGPDEAGDWERLKQFLGPKASTLVDTERVRFAASPSRGLEPVTHGWCWGRHIQQSRPPGGQREAAHDLDLAGFWWDGDSGVLHTGLLGLQELYVRTIGATTYVSSRISPLASIGPKLDVDWEAWALFLSVNHFSGEDTGFEQIRRLTFGSRLEFTATSGPATAIDVPEWVRQPRYPARIEDVWRSIRAAVRPRFGEEVDLTLSGGLDSRLILAALERRPWVRTAAWTTHGIAGDFEMAEAVAAGRTRSHSYVESTVEQWRDNFLPTARRLEHQTSAHTWLQPLSDAVRSRNLTLYDGLGGDMILRRRPLAEDRDVVGTGWLAATGGRWEREDQFLSPEFRWQYGEALRDKWTARGDLWSGHPAELPLRHFTTRINRGIALSAFRLFAPMRRVVTPFTDPGVFRVAIGLPPADQEPIDYRDLVLQRFAPNLQALPATGQPNTLVLPFQDRTTAPNSIAHMIDIIEQEPAAVIPLDSGLRALMAESDHVALKWQARLLASAAILSDWLTVWRSRLEGADSPWT